MCWSPARVDVLPFHTLQHWRCKYTRDALFCDVIIWIGSRFRDSSDKTSVGLLNLLFTMLMHWLYKPSHRLFAILIPYRWQLKEIDLYCCN